MRREIKEAKDEQLQKLPELGLWSPSSDGHSLPTDPPWYLTPCPLHCSPAPRRTGLAVFVKTDADWTKRLSVMTNPVLIQ